jgi:hypothetical protein
LAIVRALVRRLGFTLKHIPRLENSEVDGLVKAAANNLPLLEGMFYQELETLAIEETPKAFKQILVTEFEDWRQVIIDQINNVHHSKDEASIARMAARTRSYTLVDGIPCKKGVVQPLLKCIA